MSAARSNNDGWARWVVAVVILGIAAAVIISLAGCQRGGPQGYGDGKWTVGKKGMVSGHYEARVPDYGTAPVRLYFCQFYVSSQPDDVTETIVSNNGEPTYGDPGQVVEIDIDAEDSQQAVFLTDGCGTWHRVR